MDQNNDKPKGGLQIPCVYCGHSNPADFRFCGMCGKALPDLVKQAAKVSEGASGSPMPGSGIGMAGRPPAQPPRQAPVVPPAALPVQSVPNVQAVPPFQPSIPPPVKPVQHAVPPSPKPAARQENPNRDLSYLLHDDHTPAPTNRTPFVVGALILVAVAGFFAMRGGKTTPASSSVGDAATAKSPDASPAQNATSPVKTEDPKPEQTTEAKNETPTPEPKAVEPDTPPSPAVETPKPVAKAAPRPTPARSIPHASHKPAPQKPSPSQHVAAVSEPSDVDEAAPPSSSDCEKQLPAMQRGAARGDIRSRTGLGLMYYAGRCVPRDLPTAYKWYALALHAQPDNSQVSAQLEAIWKQMSPAERQLALKAQ